MDNMTALVSAFARAYHTRSHEEPVFADPVAQELLTKEEWAAISKNMSQGIGYFAPGFQGTPEEALRFIVDHQLAPSVLARSAFCERAIGNAIRLGCRQIVIYACGYDTLSLRTENPELCVYELDRPEMIQDRAGRIGRAHLAPVCRVEAIGCDLSQPGWKEKLTQAGLDLSRSSFSSLLGISYYLTKAEWKGLIEEISSLGCEGASLCLDYPMQEEGEESEKNRELAAAAGEQMKARYTYAEMEELLAEAGFLIYEHLDAREATGAFFAGRDMAAPAGVGYCLAVKKNR